MPTDKQFLNFSHNFAADSNLNSTAKHQHSPAFAPQFDGDGENRTVLRNAQRTQQRHDAAAIRDAREEETLSIARIANNIASRAERWAMYAAIAAVIALIISIVRSQN